MFFVRTKIKKQAKLDSRKCNFFIILLVEIKRLWMHIYAPTVIFVFCLLIRFFTFPCSRKVKPITCNSISRTFGKLCSYRPHTFQSELHYNHISLPD